MSDATTSEDLLQRLTITDGEVHTGESRPDLMEYLGEDIRQDEEDGYAFGPDEFGPIQWDGWDRTAGGRIEWDHFSLDDAESFDRTREQFGIDRVVYSPGPAFRIPLIPDHRTRVAYMRAYNRLAAERFARADGTHYAKLLVLGEHPRESVEEIEAHGGDDGFIGAFITDIGPTQPLGHDRYEPLWAALEKYDLPLILHSTSGIHAGFPVAGMNPKNFLEFHTLAHPIAKMWHATSILTSGIPERYDVDIGFWEGGVSWIQTLANRMDREYVERPHEAPHLEKPPSEYLSGFYYGTQPVEEPRKPEYLGTILEMNDLEDQFLFTSDFPHMDFDATVAISEHEGLTYDQKRKILQDNAEDLFGF